MIAASILFNAGQALGATLGIGQDPIFRFRFVDCGAALGIGHDPIDHVRLVAALFHPSNHILAGHRTVRFLAAYETKGNGAIDARGHGVRFQDGIAVCACDLLAAGTNAPAEQVSRLDKGPELVGLVFGQRALVLFDTSTR
jgi:hypothetical protein